MKTNRQLSIVAADAGVADRESPVRVVGLDLSLRGTGIVVLGRDGAVELSDVIGEELSSKSSDRDRVERLVRILDRVTGVVRDEVSAHGRHGVAVGIERYAYSRRGAQNDLAELQGNVKVQLWLLSRIVPEVIVASAARKAVLGHGAMPKKDIVPELRRRGLEFTDHNVADAYVIAECLRRRRIVEADR